MSRPTLLACGAHPDDETFFTGTLAKYAAGGVRVGVLCGTRGERGSTADLCSIEELPRIREAELRSAMAVIGVADQDVHFLPYEDQQLTQAPLVDARREIVRVIRLLQPQVVVGFDLQGMNGHPDHIAMSRLTSDAIAAAADWRWYPEAGASHSVSRLLWAPPYLPWTLEETEPLSELSAVDFLIDTTQWASVKAAAIRCHRTQFPGLNRLFFEHGYPEYTVNQEAFRLAFGPRPSVVPCGDLFDGLNDAVLA